MRRWSARKGRIQIQLETHEAVDMLIALARIARGKISPVTTQAIGPQVEAKAAMLNGKRKRMD